MIYLIVAYLIFIAVYALLSSIGLYYLRAAGRGNKFSKRVILFYKILSAIIIMATFAVVIFENL